MFKSLFRERNDWLISGTRQNAMGPQKMRAYKQLEVSSYAKIFWKVIE